MTKKRHQKKVGQTRNANRRLNNRLWGEKGEEFSRTATTKYYHANPEEILDFLRCNSPRWGILYWSSPIRWISAIEGASYVKKIDKEGVLLLEDREFGVTFWHGENDTVLLFEEIH